MQRGRAIKRRSKSEEHQAFLIPSVLRKIAQVLLRLGLDAPKAERLMRVAFLEAAVEKSRLAPNRATQSQIASFSGLSRLEVRKLSRSIGRQAIAGDSSDSRIDRLLEGWRTDPEFLDARRRPKPLVSVGANSEFSRLAKRYGRDVTPRALLKQMVSLHIGVEKRGLVSISRESNRQRAEMSAARGDLRFLLDCLKNYELQSGKRTFSATNLILNTSDSKTAQLLKTIASSRIQTVLDSMRATQIRSHNPKRPRSTSNRVVIQISISTESKRKSE